MKFVYAYFFCSLLISCSTTKIYLVRHAEKESADPKADLKNPEGYTRALKLKDTLRHITISAVHSTNTPRTIHTAEPTAVYNNLPITVYNNGNNLLDSLLIQKNKNFLVVGHSNTIPKMIRYLKLDPGFEGNIADNDFSNFFVVVKKWRGKKYKISLVKTKY